MTLHEQIEHVFFLSMIGFEQGECCSMSKSKSADAGLDICIIWSNGTRWRQGILPVSSDSLAFSRLQDTDILVHSPTPTPAIIRFPRGEPGACARDIFNAYTPVAARAPVPIIRHVKHSSCNCGGACSVSVVFGFARASAAGTGADWDDAACADITGIAQWASARR